MIFVGGIKKAFPRFIFKKTAAFFFLNNHTINEKHYTDNMLLQIDSFIDSLINPRLGPHWSNLIMFQVFGNSEFWGIKI